MDDRCVKKVARHCFTARTAHGNEFHIGCVTLSITQRGALTPLPPYSAFPGAVPQPYIVSVSPRQCSRGLQSTLNGRNYQSRHTAFSHDDVRDVLNAHQKELTDCDVIGVRWDSRSKPRYRNLGARKAPSVGSSATKYL